MFIQAEKSEVVFWQITNRATCKHQVFLKTGCFIVSQHLSLLVALQSSFTPPYLISTSAHLGLLPPTCHLPITHKTSTLAVMCVLHVRAL